MEQLHAIAPRVARETESDPAVEAAQDLFFGQAVMLWARWSVVAGGALIALWSSTTILELTIRMLPVLVLMALNFYMHGRFAMGQPANRRLTVIASTIDVVAITAGVILLPGGFFGQVFVFYYPVLLAFALVLPPRLTAVFTAATCFTYLLAVTARDGGFATDPQLDKVMIERLLTMAAMGALGTYYWRIQRRRRSAEPGR